MSKSEKKSARLNSLFTSKELFNMSACLRSLLVHIKELSELKAFLFLSWLQRPIFYIYSEVLGISNEPIRIKQVLIMCKNDWCLYTIKITVTVRPSSMTQCLLTNRLSEQFNDSSQHNSLLVGPYWCDAVTLTKSHWIDLFCEKIKILEWDESNSL